MKGTYNSRIEIRTEYGGRFLIEMMGRGSFPFRQTGFPVMENCTNSGLCVLDESSTLDGHIGFLGLNNLQSTGSHPLNMMGHHHHHHRPLSSSSFSDNTVPGGPTCISGQNQLLEMRPKRKSSDSINYHVGWSTGNGLIRTLQPFDISSRTAFKSPGGGDMAGVAVGFPFTWAQWKELQRQAMVYKYMMHSVPVPPHLLLPFTTTLSSSITTGAAQSSLNNGKDAEPGRCKRTDGKKWRCSRDVAPHQKYCERHLHRGRPRSRKPVELVHNNNNSSSSKKTRLLHNHHSLPPIPNNPKPQPIVSDENVYNRGLDCCAIVSDQQWQHLLQQSNLGGLTTDTSSVFHQDLNLEEPQNQIPYTDFGAPEFFNPDLVYYLQEQPQLETPIRRGFIDAWSNKDNPTNTNKNESSVSSSTRNHLSPSSLTLSMAMAAGDVLDEEIGQIQMGLGVTESDREKPQNSSWLMSPVSWVGSEHGGPLAEALRLSGGAAVSSDSTSGPATRVSSPSGVLQRTMVSMSDNSSGCNSPTIAAAPEVMPFQWLI